MRIGVDRYLQRFTEGYLPILERTKRVKILGEAGKSPPEPIYRDVSNLYDGIRNSPADTSVQEGFISCQDPTDTSQWIVLVPKYLTPTAPSGSLKQGVCPSYEVGDPLFIGRLADPVYIGPVDKNNPQEGDITYEGSRIGNTHPFIADAFAADGRDLIDRRWHENPIEPSPTATSIDRMSGGSRKFYDPRLFCFYIDLNVDGRTRCAGGDIIQTTTGVSAPNVWL